MKENSKKKSMAHSSSTIDGFVLFWKSWLVAKNLTVWLLLKSWKTGKTRLNIGMGPIMVSLASISLPVAISTGLFSPLKLLCLLD